MSKRWKPDGPDGVLRQVAALPYRYSAEGRLEVLLVTTKTTRRFILPRGWPEKKLKDAEAAAKEAMEEAGVVGTIEKKPFAQYQYWKRIDDDYVSVSVDLFALRVTEQLADWREKAIRLTRWVSVQEAALLTDEPQLARLIEAFSDGKRPKRRVVS